MDVSELLADSSTDSYLFNGDPRNRAWSTSPRSKPSPETESRAVYHSRAVIALQDPSVDPSQRPETGIPSDSSFLPTDTIAYPSPFKRSESIQHTVQAATIQQPITFSSLPGEWRWPGGPPSIPTVKVSTNEVTCTSPSASRCTSKSQAATTGDLVAALEAELAEIELRYIVAGPTADSVPNAPTPRRGSPLRSGSSSVASGSSGASDVSSKPVPLASLPTPNLTPWAPALNSRVIPASSAQPITALDQYLSAGGTSNGQDPHASSPMATDSPVHRLSEGPATGGSTAECGASAAAFLAGTVLRGAAVSLGGRTNQVQWSVASFARSLGSAAPQAPSTPTGRLGVASGFIAHPTQPTAPSVDVFSNLASTVQMATLPPGATAAVEASVEAITIPGIDRRDVDDRPDRTPGLRRAGIAAAVDCTEVKWASAGSSAGEKLSAAESLQLTGWTSTNLDRWRSNTVLSEDRWEDAGATRVQLSGAGSTGGSFLSTLEMMVGEEAASSRAVPGARPEVGTSAVAAASWPLTAPDRVSAEAAAPARSHAGPAQAGAAAVFSFATPKAATVVPAPAAQHVGAARSLAALFESNAQSGGKDRAKSSQCGLQGDILAQELDLNIGARRAVKSQQVSTGLTPGIGEAGSLSQRASNVTVGEALSMMSPQQLPEPHPQRPLKHHEQLQQPRPVPGGELATARPEYMDDRGQGQRLIVTNAASLGAGHADLDPVRESASDSFAAAIGARDIMGARAASLLQQLRAELDADRRHVVANYKNNAAVGSLDTGGLGCLGDNVQMYAAGSPKLQDGGSCSAGATLGEPLPPAETVVASGLQPDVRRSIEGLLADVEGIIADLGAAASRSFTRGQLDVAGLAVEQNGAPRQQLQPLPDLQLTSQPLPLTSELPHLQQQQQRQEGPHTFRTSSPQQGVLLQATQQQGPLHPLPQLPTSQLQQQPPPVHLLPAPQQPQEPRPPLPSRMDPLPCQAKPSLQSQQLKRLAQKRGNLQEYSYRDQPCEDRLENHYNHSCAVVGEDRRKRLTQEQHLLQPQILAEQQQQQGADHLREQRLNTPQLQQEQQAQEARLLVPQRPQAGDWQQGRQPQTTQQNRLGMPAGEALWLHHPILAGPERIDHNSDQVLVQRGGVGERWHGLGNTNEAARRWLERHDHRSLTVHSTLTRTSPPAASPSRLGLTHTGPGPVAELEDRAGGVEATALALIEEIEQRLEAEEKEKSGDEDKAEMEGKAEEDKMEMERCRESGKVEQLLQGDELIGPPPSFGDDWLLQQLHRCLDRVTQFMDTMATSKALVLAEAQPSSCQPPREARQVALQALQDRLVEVTARYNARRQRRHAGRCGGTSCASLTYPRLRDKTSPDQAPFQEQHHSHKCPSQQFQSPHPLNQELNDATRDGQPSSSLRNILAQLASLAHPVATGILGPTADGIATDVVTAAAPVERRWENGGDCIQSISCLNSLKPLVPRDAASVLQSSSAILPQPRLANSRRPEPSFSANKLLASGMFGAIGATTTGCNSNVLSIVGPTVATAIGGGSYSGSDSSPEPRGQNFNPASMGLLQSATAAVAPLATMPATAESAATAAVGPQVRLHRSMLERLGPWQQRMHANNIRPPWDQSLAAAREFQPRRPGPGCRPGLRDWRGGPLGAPLSAPASARCGTAALSAGAVAPLQLGSSAPDAHGPHPSVLLLSPRPARLLSPSAPHAYDVYERSGGVTTPPCAHADTPALLTPEAHLPTASPIVAPMCALTPTGRWPSAVAAPGASVLMPGNSEEAEELHALCSLAKSLPHLDALERMQLWERLEQFLAQKLARSPLGGYNQRSLSSSIGQRFPFNGAAGGGGIYSRSNSPLRGYATVWEHRQRGSSTGSSGGASFSPWERRSRYRMEDGKHRRQGSDGTDRIVRRVTPEQLRQSISPGTSAAAGMGAGMQLCAGPACGGGSLLDTTLEAVHNMIAPNATLAHALTLNWQSVRSQTTRMEPGGSTAVRDTSCLR